MKESGEDQRRKQRGQGCENAGGERFYGSMLSEVFFSKRVSYSCRAKRDRRELGAKRKRDVPL